MRFLIFCFETLARAIGFLTFALNGSTWLQDNCKMTCSNAFQAAQQERLYKSFISRVGSHRDAAQDPTRNCPSHRPQAAPTVSISPLGRPRQTASPLKSELGRADE